MDALSTPLVRPALELACAVAKEGTRCRPPVAVPGAMRPLVRFSRLPDRALETVRHVLEEDVEFRERVAAVADEEAIGRVPWLWLVRPEGWIDETTSAAAASEAASQIDVDRRADRDARRRLGMVEAALQRAEVELDETRAASAALTAELFQLRQERRSDIVAASRDRGALAGAVQARDAAERRALDAETRHADLEQLLSVTEARLSVSEAVNRQLMAQFDAARSELAAGDRAREAEEGRTAAMASALGEAVAEAAVAASRLGVALTTAAQVLDGGPDLAPETCVTNLVDAVPVRRQLDDVSMGKRGPVPGTGGRPLRRPVPLPRAMFDDSPDAAAWLVRLPGVVLIVDGYNVTLNAWSQRDLPDQRHRLVTALAELSMRTGADVEVVFDGADDHVHPLRSTPARRPVRIVFSPPSVEADEVIIERVTRLPASRPVIVATNDRRVRDACSRAGANLLSTEQLVTVLGRAGGPGRP